MNAKDDGEMSTKRVIKNQYFQLETEERLKLNTKFFPLLMRLCI